MIDVPWKLPPCPGWNAGNGSGWNPGKTPFAPKGLKPGLNPAPVPTPPDVDEVGPFVSPKRLFRFGLFVFMLPTGTKPKFCGNPELNGNAF